mmetsp:Transcript_44674/g.62101  ORF Transcript_44674/g.62101 Transcript_44674/m.62101 type:complete len:217 (+) Transcript_44674:222-872(+)
MNSWMRDSMLSRVSRLFSRASARAAFSSSMMDFRRSTSNFTRKSLPLRAKSGEFSLPLSCGHPRSTSSQTSHEQFPSGAELCNRLRRRRCESCSSSELPSDSSSPSSSASASSSLLSTSSRRTKPPVGWDAGAFPAAVVPVALGPPNAAAGLKICAAKGLRDSAGASSAIFWLEDFSALRIAWKSSSTESLPELSSSPSSAAWPRRSSRSVSVSRP